MTQSTLFLLSFAQQTGHTKTKALEHLRVVTVPGAEISPKTSGGKKRSRGGGVLKIRETKKFWEGCGRGALGPITHPQQHRPGQTQQPDTPAPHLNPPGLPGPKCSNPRATPPPPGVILQFAALRYLIPATRVKSFAGPISRMKRLSQTHEMIGCHTQIQSGRGWSQPRTGVRAELLDQGGQR